MFNVFFVALVFSGFKIYLYQCINSTITFEDIAINGTTNPTRKLSGTKMSRYNLNRMWRTHGTSPEYITRSSVVNQSPFTDVQTTMIIPSDTLAKQSQVEFSSIAVAPQSYATVSTTSQSNNFVPMARPTYMSNLYTSRTVPSARFNGMGTNQVFPSTYIESISSPNAQSSVIQTQVPDTYGQMMQNQMTASMMDRQSTIMSNQATSTMLSNSHSSSAFVDQTPSSTSIISQGPSTTTTTLVENPTTTVITHNTGAGNLQDTSSPAALMNQENLIRSKISTSIDNSGIKTSSVTHTMADTTKNSIVTSPGTVSVAVQPVTTYSPVSISTTPSVTVIPGFSTNSDMNSLNNENAAQLRRLNGLPGEDISSGSLFKLDNN